MFRLTNKNLSHVSLYEHLHMSHLRTNLSRVSIYELSYLSFMYEQNLSRVSIYEHLSLSSIYEQTCLMSRLTNYAMKFRTLPFLTRFMNQYTVHSPIYEHTYICLLFTNIAVSCLALRTNGMEFWSFPLLTRFTNQYTAHSPIYEHIYNCCLLTNTPVSCLDEIQNSSLPNSIYDLICIIQFIAWFTNTPAPASDKPTSHVSAYELMAWNFEVFPS